jgi:hypothetical protein
MCGDELSQLRQPGCPGSGIDGCDGKLVRVVALHGAQRTKRSWNLVNGVPLYDRRCWMTALVARKTGDTYLTR